MRGQGSRLIVAGFALIVLSGCVSPVDPSGHDHAETAEHGHEAADHSHHGSGGHAAHSFRQPMGFDRDDEPDLSREPPFPLEQGQRPGLDEAEAFADRYGSVRVKGNEGLAKLRAEGYIEGSGTKDDPYVLDKFYVDRDLTIESVDRALILREGYVKGTLRLNYVGEDLYVHHVYARDLRVNENIERTGPNTGGLFHDNAFAVVGQIRHFVGEFRNNVIGPRPQGFLEDALGDTGPFPIPEGVVFNLDGFHRAIVHDNAYEGSVLIKLHGHNHGDCFTCPVHDHVNATLDAERMAGHEHQYSDEGTMLGLGFLTHHSVRYASLAFHDNEIRFADGVALTYHDRNHAGDDRTANSEENESLDDPHVHFQDVTFARNVLAGGGFRLDIFNAEDDRHAVQNLGIVRLLDNELSVHYTPSGPIMGHAPSVAGVQLGRADGLELVARGNVVRFSEERSGLMQDSAFDSARPPIELIGFLLDDVDASNLTLAANRVESGQYGVFASRFSETAHWTLAANDFRTDHAWRGRDVAEPPKEDP